MVRDIRSLNEQEKFKIYDQLEEKHHGKITLDRHSSGFPAVTISVDGKLEYITDILSVEKWWRKRKGLTHFIIFPPKGAGYGLNAKTVDEAIQEAAKYFKVRPSDIDESKGWKIEKKTE